MYDYLRVGGITTTLPANPGADAPSVSILVPDTGHVLLEASYQGDANNLASSTTCDNVDRHVHRNRSSPRSTATPDPVTAGQLVQYKLTVTNASPTSIAGVNVIDTLPGGTTLFSATSSSGCSGTDRRDVLRSERIAGGGSASTALLVTDRLAGPDHRHRDRDTRVEQSSQASTSTSWLRCRARSRASWCRVRSLNTGGNDPTTFSLPDDRGYRYGNGCAGDDHTGSRQRSATVRAAGSPRRSHRSTATRTRRTRSWRCSRTRTRASSRRPTTSCTPTSTSSTTRPRSPARSSRTARTTRRGARRRRRLPRSRRIARVGTQSGIANPVPCIDARSITIVSKYKYTVTFTVLYLSGDPHLARK